MSRPSKLLPAVEAKLVELVAAGLSIASAAAYLRLPLRSLQRWLERGREARSGPCRRLLVAVEQARAQGELRDLLHIKKAAQAGNVKALMWLLERTRPENWARRAPVVVEDESVEVKAMRIRAALRQMDESFGQPPPADPETPPQEGPQNA